MNHKCYLCKKEKRNPVLTADFSIYSTRINTKHYICSDHAYELGYITAYGNTTQLGDNHGVTSLYVDDSWGEDYYFETRNILGH